jgi:hypothetical protein
MRLLPGSVEIVPDAVTLLIRRGTLTVAALKRVHGMKGVAVLRARKVCLSESGWMASMRACCPDRLRPCRMRRRC